MPGSTVHFSPSLTAPVAHTHRCTCSNWSCSPTPSSHGVCQTVKRPCASAPSLIRPKALNFHTQQLHRQLPAAKPRSHRAHFFPMPLSAPVKKFFTLSTTVLPSSFSGGITVMFSGRYLRERAQYESVHLHKYVCLSPLLRAGRQWRPGMFSRHTAKWPAGATSASRISGLVVAGAPATSRL